MGNKKEVIQFKDSKVCVLAYRTENEDDFYREFSSVTSQGYELKATFNLTTNALGFGGATGVLFYFQYFENLKST